MAGFASYMAERLMESVRRVICALRGHEDYLQFEKNRMFLHCISCGHQSPGWTIDPRQSLLRFESRRGQSSTRALLRKTA